MARKQIDQPGARAKTKSKQQGRSPLPARNAPKRKRSPQLSKFSRLLAPKPAPVSPLEVSPPPAAVPVNSAPPTARPPRRRQQRQPWIQPLRGWPLFWLSTFGVVGGVSLIAFLWLTSLPPLPNCDQMTVLSSDMDRLYCARQDAQSGEIPQLLQAIALVESWPSSHPLHAEAQDLLANWSTSLLAIARSRIEVSDLEGAVEIASHVPTNSPMYADAQAAIAQWQQLWQQGEAIYAKAEAAMRRQDWKDASEQVIALGRLPYDYWQRQRVGELTAQILREQAAWKVLNQARQQAKASRLEELGQAIAVAQQVDPNTLTWEEAKANIDQWNQTLLSEGMQRWRQGNWVGAMALGQQVALEATSDPEAQDLIKFSQAQKLADWDIGKQWQPSPAQIWGLLEAIAALQQIQSGSTFYTQAQAHLQDWQQQVADVTQLQYAHLTASLGYHPALTLAIEQAESIDASRSRRIQAQTLIAHWTKEIQRIEDRPHLAQARQLAESGEIPGLQAAIARAEKIQPGRALSEEAETLISSWIRQIQTIEDQPLLDEAWALAQQGSLSRAITAAARIQQGRALYAEAQTAIGNWRAEIRRIQIAEDQPLLNEAYSLAKVGSLSLAIEAASQIAPGRLLYGEAQAAIAQWKVERQQIWDSWAAEANRPQNDPEPSPRTSDATSESSGSSYEGYYDERYYEREN